MVEFASIGSLLTRKRNKAKNLSENPPVYAVTNDKGFALSSELHDFTIHSEDTSNYLVVEKYDFAYNPSRLNIGSIDYFKFEGRGLISPMYVVFHADENKILPKYLFTLLKSEAIRNRIDSLKEVGARFRFDYERWNLIEIPIPSLQEQARIVGILDTFTASIENLKKQIAERRKQYEHYRDQLLDLEGKEGVEMKTLPQVSTNCDRERKPITSSKRVSGIYPYYGASGIVDYVDGYIFDGDYLLISEDGANLLARTTPIAFSIKGKNWVNNHAHVLLFKERVTQKFVEIYLNMINLEPWINGAAQPKLNQDNLNRIEIPFPSLDEQSRIISILDTFEASIANLEAQLKLREKQYEYYRNKLLTF